MLTISASAPPTMPGEPQAKLADWSGAAPTHTMPIASAPFRSTTRSKPTDDLFSSAARLIPACSSAGFNSKVRQVEDEEPLKGRDFIGISIGGPTRIGHYFLPEFATAQGEHGRVKEGPVIKPGKTYEWTLVYDPAANEGRGQMRVTLGDESVTLDLKAGDAKIQKRPSSTASGIFCVGTGGGQVKVFFDELKYTAVKP